ncbi:MAG: S-layer homology domain-containing protein [Candidatus Gastranaerophilales bacterium]|nr:S-layer homology domain-containing protein [Candidatus Gastranaerophilales bacterium]
MRKIFILIALFLGITFLPARAVEEFPDVGPDYWSYDAIMYFKDKNVLSGYPDGYYRPDQKVTRAEFATILTKALGLRNLDSITFTSYKDVDSSYWAYYDIMLGSYYDLVHGTPEGMFYPKNYITRLEIIMVIMKALSIKEITEQEALEQLSVFNDAKDVPYWATLTTGKAQQLGLIVLLPGKEDYILPKQDATRGELAVWLYGMLQRAAIQPSEKLPEAPKGPRKADGYIIKNVIFDENYAIIPAGTILPLGVMDCLFTKTTKEGTEVLTRALVNFVSEDRTLLIPIGSEMTGVIDKVSVGHTLIKNSQMVYRTEYLIDSNTRQAIAPFKAVGQLTPKVREFTHNPILQKIGFKGFMGHNFYTHKSQQVDFVLLEEIKIDLEDDLHIIQ